MVRFPPVALAALLAVSSTGGGDTRMSPSVAVSAYISPTNFQNNQQSQRRNLSSSSSSSSLAASRSGTSTSSTFRPLFDDANRLSPLDDSGARRIPKTGSTGGAVSLDQSSSVNRRNRREGDVGRPNQRQQQPPRGGGRSTPAKKKGPLWGMFPGNSNNGNKGGSSRRREMVDTEEPARMPQKVRLSDIGKQDTDDVPMRDVGGASTGRRNNADDVIENAAGGNKKVWGGRYGSSNSTDMTDSSYFGPRGGGPGPGPGGPGPGPGPYGPPPDEYLYDDGYDEEAMMYEQERQRDMMDGPGGGGGPGGGVDAYGRPNRASERMNAPPMDAPPQQPPRKNKGRREPNLFDKVSNFMADSGTIAVLKTEIGFLEREAKARKERFGVDAYDAIDQLEYEHDTFLRRLEEEGRSADQDAIDADLDRMEADKEFRIRRLYENARRDIVGFEREIGYKEEEIMDIEAFETEKQDAAWDEYRRPGDGGGRDGDAGTPTGINVGRKDKYVRIPNDPNAVSNTQQQQQQQQQQNQDQYGRVPKTPPPMQQPPPPQSQPQAQTQAQTQQKSVRLSDIGKEEDNDRFNGGQDYFSNPLEGRGTRPQQERTQQPRGRINDVGKQQTIDEIFDNLDRRQGERRQQDDEQQRQEAFDRQENFDRRFEDEFDDRMPPPPPRSSGFQQPPPQQPREPIVPPPRQQEERQPIIPPPPRPSAPAQQQRPSQPMNQPMDVGRDAEWNAPSNGPQRGSDQYGENEDEFDRYGRKISGGSPKRGDEWEPPRFADGSDRKVY